MPCEEYVRYRLTRGGDRRPSRAPHITFLTRIPRATAPPPPTTRRTSTSTRLEVPEKVPSTCRQGRSSLRSSPANDPEADPEERRTFNIAELRRHCRGSTEPSPQGRRMWDA